MSIPIADTAFVGGELSPSLFGSVDLAKWHSAAATMRNCFPAIQRGAYSRAGTAFVGFSKQTGRNYPPRLLPFQFSIDQGLILEFGNYYMRVISEGAFVTEAPYDIQGITNANPAVVSILGVATGQSATPINAGVTASYAPGNTVSLAGGTFSTRGVLTVGDTTLTSIAVSRAGTSGVYAPGDQIALAGGVQATPAILLVTTTEVIGLSLAYPGRDLAPGSGTCTGSTGTGQKFVVNCTVGGTLGVEIVGAITVPGNYTVNPNNPGYEPCTWSLGGGGIAVPPAFNLVIGVRTVAIFAGGLFSTNPAGGNFTQASTTGQGLGATFGSAIMGPGTVSFSTPGAYTVVPNNPVAQSSSSGSGLGATFNVVWTLPGTLKNGDWVYIAGANGMTQVNGQTFVVAGETPTSIQLSDIYGNTIDSTAFGAWTSGGTVSRIFTLTSPYSEQDLDFLKFTQSADVLSLCCVNQRTAAEYLPYDLARTTDTNWTFAPLATQATVQPPPAASGTASAGGSVDYAYVITAVSPVDGTESVASPIASISSAVDIATTAGSITLKWTPSPTPNVALYNIYKAEPGFGVAPPVGSLFGYAGQAAGTQFVDSNIVADFVQVPSKHANPFARGIIEGVAPIAQGATYTNPSYTIATNTGSGAVIEPIVISGAIPAYIVTDPGQNYLPTDTILISDSTGTGALASLNIGPQSGTYPAVPVYFQERRGYGYTLNNPDTYWFSQPGSFTNFDVRSPTIDSDAIEGTPWAVEVNGIQFMLTTAGGLLIFTGLSVWLLVGSGSFATNVQPISPASQNVNPQPEIGCSSTVMPIKIDYDVLYVSSKDSIYFDLPYQLYALSWPLDITVTSSHLFKDHTIIQHAWCREPYKLLWAVRDDGILLSLTWLKPEQVAGWARHDTNGKFVGCAAITEPPVDALYVATQRQIGANQPYIIERMDNRLWNDVEDCWCVDCGFSLAQPAPNATLTVSSATGLGSVTGATNIIGGGGYSAATTGSVIDAPLTAFGPPGPGTGAVPTLGFTGGVLTSVTFSGANQGSAYLNPQLLLTDPAGSQGGSGASATLILNNAATFTASASVFSAPNVGSVIRAGGGIAQITTFTDGQHVTANILLPIVDVIPNSGGAVVSQSAGSWTMTAPVSSVYVPQLAGATVTGLADGNVISPVAVPANGVVTLSTAASNIVIGFGFQAQLQSLYLDAGQPTMQGQRKTIARVTARLEASRDVKIGSNQIDGSTLSPSQNAPTWTNLDAVPNVAPKPYNALAAPLWTGDSNAVPVTGGYQKPGQVALQQDNPLPMQVLLLAPSILPGDLPENEAKPRRQAARG